ncbi:hypothetical protein M0R04_06410 [Candidatus Dojkabacteria bacterium]|jgi:hypothetical protein|nr:hypothetical protein [Candidatus Dojkabacteria bacterium]
MNNKQYLIDFFEKQWPELEKAARAVWGDHKKTGFFTGTISCPKDGLLASERATKKEDWEKATDQAKFCKVCGSPLKVELSEEIVYEYEWREFLLEMLLDEKKDGIFKIRLDELKGIKPKK